MSKSEIIQSPPRDSESYFFNNSYKGRHRSEYSRRFTLGRVSNKTILALVAAIIMAVLLVRLPDSLDHDARITLIVFFMAVWLWVFSAIDDTYVALCASTVLVLTGVLDTKDFFDSLGETTTWLLIGAFVISSAVAASGLALRGTVLLTSRAQTPRTLVHVLTFALVCTVFAVPATSGRAALALPVFLVLARVLPKSQQWLVIVLSLVFPTVILFSAVGSLIGAGAHLITNQVLGSNGLQVFSFPGWLLAGLPLALVSSHAAAEVVLWVMSTRGQRREPVDVSLEALARHAGGAEKITGALSPPEWKSLLVLCLVVVLWSAEPLHGIHPALVALLGALLVTSPLVGSVALGKALKKVPWGLLLFMAATLAMSQALTSSGAAQFIADHAFRMTSSKAAGVSFILLVICLSTLAHLLVQSRSARSAVLIPIVVTLAPGVGVNPVAAAFISTAAAGFCHTLPASAKPLAMFNMVDADVAVFSTKQLLRVSLFLLPVHVASLVVFAFWVWPHLGIPLYL